MQSVQDFMTAYPLSARAAIHTPIVFRAGFFSSDDLPWPSLEGIRDFARFCGIEDGAVRTALSRARAESSLLVQTDPTGRNRYLLAPATFAMGTSQIHTEPRPQGFLLAVFSFRAEEEDGRAALRTLLKSYGFRKLAQNTYIQGRIETEGLRSAIRELGLENHFYLFTCPDVEDKHLIARILKLFDVEGRRNELRNYLALLTSFLPEDLPRNELARRLLYVGAVHWERIEAGEPPIPSKYLPNGYPFSEIQRFYGKRLDEGRNALLEYYREVNR